MRIIRDTVFIDPSDRGAAAAIGNFDGVHIGHRAVIDLTRAAAKAANAPLGIMTFEPHPRSYFSRDDSPFRLMSAEAKANRLAKLGVEKLYEVPFNEALANLTPREFDLLYYFARHPGEVFSRLALLEQVWGYQHEGYEHTVNTHINRLRSKIERDPAEPDIILTVWGKGYKFAPMSQEVAP